MHSISKKFPFPANGQFSVCECEQDSFSIDFHKERQWKVQKGKWLYSSYMFPNIACFMRFPKKLWNDAILQLVKVAKLDITKPDNTTETQHVSVWDNIPWTKTRNSQVATDTSHSLSMLKDDSCLEQTFIQSRKYRGKFSADVNWHNSSDFGDAMQIYTTWGFSPRYWKLLLIQLVFPSRANEGEFPMVYFLLF